jgi:hypothetical protein
MERLSICKQAHGRRVFLVYKRAMNKAFRALDKTFAAAAIATAIAFCPVPQDAQAQNWNYNPYTGGSTWLGISRLVQYPFNRFSTPTAPLYLASPLIRYGTYYAGQRVTNSSRNFNYGNYAGGDDAAADPRQRTRPVVSDGNGVSDQIVHAKPFRHDNSNSTNGDPSGNADPAAVSPGSSPPTAPPIAPSRPGPPAGGFIDLVNSKYQGDISKALFDPDVRAYARAVGLIDNDGIFDADLKPQKVQTIRGILADTHEDATVRINAVRMLLKH